MKTSIFNLQNNTDIFACTICGCTGAVKNSSFICRNGHCFDISAKGYINFAPHQKATKYSKNIFESRRAVFSDGFYNTVLLHLAKFVEENLAPGRITNILDAGCGEGYYSAYLKACETLQDKTNIIAMDIEKAAILLACRGQCDYSPIVGDINKIPLADNTADILLNILTPANYSEFSRVLRPGGIIIKIIPGENYLAEIRTAIAGKIKAEAYSTDRVLNHFKQNMKLLSLDKITCTLPVTNSQALDFFNMTPMTMDISADEVDLSRVNTITIDLAFVVGQARS